MPNIATVLKAEISRIARKVVRDETSALKKSVAAHRAELSTLKRRTRELEQERRRRARTTATTSAPAEQSAPAGSLRFSAKGLASQRRRLGLSAQEVGLLLGVSVQSIYNWEEGKARPRAQHLPAIFALRNLGRRQANEILETRSAA